MSLCAPAKPGEDRKHLARRLRPHRAHPLRRRRDRHAGRQGARRRVEGGRGADPAGGQARPLHHQHGLRQLRHRRRRFRRPAHQGQLHGHPRGRPTPASSTAARPPRSWCTSFPPPATRSSTCSVPASRIIGGYTVKDGVIIPRYTHGEIIEAVFRRTRVTVGLMTSAKLLSAVEPVIRYQRRRFRGGEGAPGTPRYELGLQQKEDALHRLVDIWATGEASASLGFAAARAVRRARPAREAEGRDLRRRRTSPAAPPSRPWRKMQQRRAGVPAARRQARRPRDEQRLAALKPIRWCSSSCSIRWPTSSAPPASSGTPATAPT